MLPSAVMEDVLRYLDNYHQYLHDDTSIAKVNIRRYIVALKSTEPAQMSLDAAKPVPVNRYNHHRL